MLIGIILFLFQNDVSTSVSGIVLSSENWLLCLAVITLANRWL